MAGDWIKLHRKTLKSVVSTEPILMHVWMHLLMRANYEPRQLTNGTYLQAGQLVIGQDKFAKEIGVTRQNVRTAVSTFETCDMLTSKSTNAGTMLTICNWTTYQQSDEPANQQSNQPLTNSQPTANQPLTTEEEGKKVRSKEVKKKNKGGRFTPPTPMEVSEYLATRESSQVDPLEFLAYYESQGWRKANGRMVTDWKACVRTWEAKNKRDNGKPKQPELDIIG